MLVLIFKQLKGLEENNMESIVNIQIPFWITIDSVITTLNNRKLILMDNMMHIQIII